MLIIFKICFHFVAFTQAANLRNHERIHSQVRPYVCGDCGKAFTQITNLNVSFEKLFLIPCVMMTAELDDLRIFLLQL